MWAYVEGAHTALSVARSAHPRARLREGVGHHEVEHVGDDFELQLPVGIGRGGQRRRRVHLQRWKKVANRNARFGTGR
jgi:hypothetical protein